MNRRRALLTTLLTGGLWSASARGQDARKTNRRATGAKPPARRAEDEPPEDEPAAIEGAAPPGFRAEPGYSWRAWDIGRYTALSYSAETPAPQNMIVEWIFLRTGTATWHGEKVAALNAGRNRLTAYHSAKTLDQVNDVVKRFTRANSDYLTVRVRIVTTSDTRWRYTVHTRLNRIGSGPQGQQIWTLSPEDAATVRAQLQYYGASNFGRSRFRTIYDHSLKMANGQRLTIEKAQPFHYVHGPQRDSAVGLGFQPGTQPLEEGVFLKFSPLLTYDGDALDAHIDLRSNVIRRLIRTKILTRREIGPNELTLDVPEVTETRMNQTISGWPLGQSLLISGGITPGLLDDKAGPLNLRIPGTVPTDTELLVFLDVEPTDAPRTARGRGRAEDRVREPEERD